MYDRKLYQRLLDIRQPWKVLEISLEPEEFQVLVKVGCLRHAIFNCPICGRKCHGYDKRQRRWHHLDTCNYTTVLEAELPRARCEEHGIHQVSVPWAEERSHFTHAFEKQVVGWLLEASVSAVSRHFRISWDEVHGIQQRAENHDKSHVHTIS